MAQDCTDLSITCRYPGIDSRPAVFGVVTRVQESRDDPHTNQQVGVSFSGAACVGVVCRTSPLPFQCQCSRVAIEEHFTDSV